jgi:hypothetical protein
VTTWPASVPMFDDRDQEILEEREQEWNKRTGPRVGDWIRFTDGLVLQISHLWDDSVQYTFGGSFYLGSDYQSYSGGLESGIPRDSLTLTEETKPAGIWFFHHDRARAHNGVNANVTARVYESTVKTHDYYCMKCNEMVPGRHRRDVHSPY